MNTVFECDFLIAGAGFGGSLTALVLHRLGYRVVLFDSGSHPRFSIGESSTPLADACLRELCLRYDLNGLTPLTTYGSARRELPHLVVGLKRGFSYFRQQSGFDFGAGKSGIVEQMLVMAAPSNELSDTHWLRSSVDSYFAGEVRRAGITLLECTTIDQMVVCAPWQIRLVDKSANKRQVNAKFLIDASGRAAVFASQLRPKKMANEAVTNSLGLLTHSRAIYGHFRGVQTWESMLQQAQVATTMHPFACDHAALHHLIDNGWMWQLRFDNDITSVGFAIDPRYYADLEALPAQEQFVELLHRYPSLHEQMARASCVAPEGGIRATGRMQYLELPAAGELWACLPSAVGFVDPLHSTGIAHTLYSIRALTNIFAGQPLDTASLAAPLENYAQRLEHELRFIDALVYLAYATLHDFDCFVASCMLYFVAATYAEALGVVEKPVTFESAAFLNANSIEFQRIIQQSLELLAECQCGSVPWTEYPQAIERWTRPFNFVGLFNPTLNNMYAGTAAPNKSANV